MYLNNNLVIQTSIAALLVIFGVVVKNSLEQMKIPNHPIGKPLGMVLFIFGWIYTAYVLSARKTNKMLFIVPSAFIIGSVIMMKKYMENKQSPPMIYPLLFAISWILLGYGAGNHLSGYMKYFGILASLLVLLSMMMTLPHQRKNCIIDGPGMPLFVIAWIIIVFLNSNR